MSSSYDRLGISPSSSPAEIKAAYHTKLREFPAHTHPVEFKEIRAAYEEIRKGQASPQAPFFQLRPLEATLDETVLAQLKEVTQSELKVSLDEMIRETF